MVTDGLPPSVAKLAGAHPELAAYVDELIAARRLSDEAFDRAPVGLALQSSDGRFTRVNRALCEMLGYTETELLRRTIHDIGHDGDAPGPAAGGERRWVTAAGAVLWASVSTAPVGGDGDARPRLLVTVAHDVSERRRREEELRHAAEHDDLTGLLNRRRFEQDLARQVELSRRYGESAAVVLLDLDRLKQVNDTLGHRAGDELLTYVAALLEGRLRGSDVLARLGGDEFAVLLPHADAPEALAVAEALIAAVRDGAPFGCTASAGVAVVAGAGRAAPDVLAAADSALYAAKRAGRDSAVLADG